MKTHRRELLLYYHPESSADRQTLAMAQGMSMHVRSFAYGKTPSTETSWSTILRTLGCNPKDLLNKAHPYYKSHIKGREFDEESWVKILRFNPDMIRVPIAISGRKAILCNTPSDINRLFEKR